jgi:hypothetical protein
MIIYGNTSKRLQDWVHEAIHGVDFYRGHKRHGKMYSGMNYEPDGWQDDN